MLGREMRKDRARPKWSAVGAEGLIFFIDFYHCRKNVSRRGGLQRGRLLKKGVIGQTVSVMSCF